MASGGRKRVARLLRSVGLVRCHRRQRRGLTRRDPRPRGAGPGQAAVHGRAAGPGVNADITSVPTWSGWRYLAVDVFGRWLVGWALADHLRTELVIDALGHGHLAAATHRGPGPPLQYAPAQPRPAHQLGQLQGEG